MSKHLARVRQIAYLKLGEHRGNRRLWMQGGRLERAGFLPGTRYRMTMDEKDRTLTIEISEQGERRISQKRRGDKTIPVLDINNTTLTEMFNQCVERVAAVITEHSIIISIHPDDEAAAERYARLIARLGRHEPLAIGSVSHGGGVMDHALHQGLANSGVETRLAYAVEIEHKYLEASLNNNPIWDEESIAVLGPVQEVEGHRLPKVDVYVGGIPCTGASKSGLTKNKIKHPEEHPEAGAIFFSFLSLLKQSNPSVVLLENVPDYQNTASMAVIRNMLTHLKYDVHETVLEGGQMGALEDRKRFCMVAVTRGIEFDWNNLRPVRQKESRLGEILDDVPEDSPRYRTYDYLDRKAVRDKARGAGFKQQILTPEADTVGTIGRGYSKARSTEPFLQHPEDPSLKRLLTPAEHARVKTIPEELVEGLPDTTAHEILGQSVIHSAFVAVGQLIGQSLCMLERADEKGEIIEHEYEEDTGSDDQLTESSMPLPL